MGEAEEVGHLVEEMGFDGVPVGQKSVGDAVEAHGAHALEVDFQEFSQGRALAQPAPGGALGAWPRHAGDYGGDGEGALLGAKAQALKGAVEPELLHRPQAERLDADRARPHQGQGVHVHRLQVGSFGLPCRGALKKLGSDMLGLPLDLLGAVQGHQVALAIEQLADTGAQERPVLAFDREVAAEVEQGALSDLVLVALALNETVGVIGFAVLSCAGFGASDEHGEQDIRAPGAPQYPTNTLCHYISISGNSITPNQ